MTRVSAPGAPSIHPISVLVPTCMITVSQISWLWHPSVSPNSLKYGLQTCWSRPPNVSPNLLTYGLKLRLQIRLITISECISNFPWLLPTSVSPNIVDYCIAVDLQCCLITATKCIFKCTQLQHSSVSPNMLAYCLQGHFQSRTIMATECIADFARSLLSDTPWTALTHHPHPIQIYHVE